MISLTHKITSELNFSAEVLKMDNRVLDAIKELIKNKEVTIKDSDHDKLYDIFDEI